VSESPRPIIEIESLVKSYDIVPVLRKLNLTIDRGDLVALLGPNGSGKSTLLRQLGGLSKPTSGRVVIGGWQLPREVSAVRAQIGMVSHKTLLYDNLTARENLRFFGRLYALPTAELDERIDMMLEKVGLKKRSHDLVRTFSRGMLQRLTIARALLHDPHVLLFDEPYTGLDQDAAAVLDEMLLNAHQDGHTIIMATHQLERAARLATRVVILSRGQVGYDRQTAGLDPTSLAADYAEVTGVAISR
jgi:heme ABC exporter ATP-binding subunit CcmA